MREISKEELDHYLQINQLEVAQHDETKQNSLQSTIKNFVTNLQESFPATISTVCKTADKISAHDEVETKETCIMCQVKFLLMFELWCILNVTLDLN